MARRLLIYLTLSLSFFSVFSQTTLIPYSSSWKYLDNGIDQGTSWRSTSFNDATWKTGTGKFGYGISDATTTISFGTSSNKKYITTYFRKSLALADPSTYNTYTVNVKRDDGVVIYLNGVEVYRNNLPATTISYSTLATAASDNGTTPQSFTLASSAFIAGTNVFSVEVHQSAANTPDMAFDMELIGSTVTQPPPVSNGALVNFNSSWKYLDNGSNQGTAWTASAFSDATWKTGTGKFGYGITDAATLVSFGSSSTKKYITTYFRKTISVQNPAIYPTLAGKIKRDDGVIVYINGKEVYRSNLTGNVSSTTLATESADNGYTAQPFVINSPGLLTGTNIIAVEVHQAKANTPDMAFDLELTAAAPSVLSINRQQPATSTTNSTSVTHRVTFSSPVTGVDRADFVVSVLSGSLSSTLATDAVQPVGTDGSTFDVTTSSIAGNGVIRLDLNNTGTGITNAAGIAISAGFNTGQTYTINQAAPEVSAINRQAPLNAVTAASTVVYRVIFSEAVTGVDHNDFTATTVSGAVTATIASNAIAAVGTAGTTYDVTLSSITGNGDLRLDLNNSGTGITNSLNTAITTGYNAGQVYTINQTPPTVISISRQSPSTATTNASSVTHRVVFSEAVTGVDKNDFTVTIVSGTVTATLGTNAVASVGTDGTTYDVTTSTITGSGIIRLDLNSTGTGIANNLGTAISLGFSTGDTYTIDQSTPSVVSISRQSPLTITTNATSVTHRVVFSETVTGVDKNDFTVTTVSGTVTGTLGSNAVAAIGTDGTTYDVTTSSITGSGVIRLDLNNTGTGITNNPGNLISSGFTTGDTYTINQSAPSVVSISRLSPLTATTNASLVTYRVVFSEAVTGVDKNDFTVTTISGAVTGLLATDAVAAVGTDGTSYDVTTSSISGSGVIRLDLNNSGTGINNNLGTAISSGFTSGDTYTINHLAPSVISISRHLPLTATTNATSITYRVVFSEAVTGVDRNDFTVTTVSGTVTGSLATDALAAVGTDGTTYDVTISSITGSGVIRLDLNNSGTGITNILGTAITTGFSTGDTYTVNQTAPSILSISRQSPSAITTNASSVTFRIVFSEGVTGVDKSDFSTTVVSGTVSSTLAANAVTAVGTDATTYDVTVTSIAGNGVLRLDLNSSGTGINNSIGTAISSGFNSGETYTINQTAPVVLSINRHSPLTSTTNLTLVTHRVVFSEAVTGVDNTDFTVTTVSGTVTATLASGAVAAVGTGGTTYDVTTSSIAGSGVIRLDLNNGGTGITNSLGTPISTGFSTGETYTINQTVPSVTSINRQSPLTSGTSANTVTWRAVFSEAVTGVDQSDFSVTVLSGNVTSTLASSAVQPVGSDGKTYDITLTNITGLGVIRLDLKNTGTGIINSDGTAINAGFTTGETYTISQFADDQIITYKSSWKYLDNGSDQGTAWAASTFNDNSWSTGNGLFGYGQGGEGTVISYGSNSASKYVTTYFRKTVNIPDTSQFIGYTMNFRRDDGVIIYLNGVEVHRNNMPTGTILYSTLASTNCADNGTTVWSVPLTISQLRQGTNVVAVEIHQITRGSSDIVFDMELTGKFLINPPKLVNGPYLNLATKNSIIVRWRTDSLTDTRVNYGLAANSLTGSYVDNTLSTEHIAEITGLQENTKYFYAVKAGNRLLQGDANNYFKTLPPVGSTQKIRALVTGDVGLNSSAQANVRNAYLSFNGTNYTDVWMLMGDNAYTNGLDSEYQNNFFNVYEATLTKNHVLWPAPGNHDYANTGARQADHKIPYYDLFSLPTKGEAGGIASNTEAFYSYDVGNIHFVSLDSYGWEAGNTRLYDTTGAQATWLKQDLAANKQKWTVVYFHHPPYSKGSHNSDTETELINIRQKVVRILERYKVDLVLNGHSHDYERSFMINGHYGLETTFDTATMAYSSSSSRYDGSTNSCVYVKKASDLKNGIVYAVVGSSGQVNGSTPGYPHNAMQYSNITNTGALVLEIEDNRLDAKWICNDGIVRDQFTIIKDAGRTVDTTVSSGGQLVLTASWQGKYQWSTGATTRSIIVNPLTNATYTVTDAYGCLSDLFNVTVNNAIGLANNKRATAVEEQANSLRGLKFDASVAPNPSATEFYVQLQTSSNERVTLSLSDMYGRQVYVEKGSPRNTYTMGRSFSPGMYILTIQQGTNTKTIKMIKKRF